MEATGPLRGIRVLDLSIALARPYASVLLADQGADVVKIERPGLGDIARWVGVAVNNMSAFFVMCNRGKRSIALDITQPDGLRVAMKIAQTADVVLENFRPGVLDRLGLGYEAVRAVNPGVVYASVSGFGSVGPYRHRPAYDTAMQAYAGFAANQADPRDGVPVFLRQTAADKVTALYASQAITAALFARERGLGGQHLELAMADAAVSFLWADSAGNEVLLDADGSMNSSFVAGFQPMRFTDGWGIVVPTTDADFAGMCKALGVPGYDDPRVATIAERRKNRDVGNAIMDLCYAHAADLSMAEASARFEANSVAYSMILTTGQMTQDAHAVAVGMFSELDNPVVGRVRMPRHPALFSATPAARVRPAPALGQHTDEILTEYGFGGEIGALRASKIAF